MGPPPWERDMTGARRVMLVEKDGGRKGVKVMLLGERSANALEMAVKGRSLRMRGMLCGGYDGRHVHYMGIQGRRAHYWASR